MDLKKNQSIRVKKNIDSIFRSLSLLIVYFLLTLVIFYTSNVPIIILCIFCISFIFAGLVNSAHDCIHKSQWTYKQLNAIFGNLWCAIVLLNYGRYKYKHLKHHKYLGTDKDSEKAIVFNSPMEYVTYLLGITYIKGLFQSHMLIFKIIFLTDNKEKKEILISEITLLIWLSLCVFLTIFNFDFMLTAYWMPLSLYPATLAFFSLTEHYGLSKSKDIRLCTRTVKSNFIIRYLFWNGNFHIEHHYFPIAPSNKLKYIHQQLSSNTHCFENSYLMFHFRVLNELLLLGKTNEKK